MKTTPRFVAVFAMFASSSALADHSPVVDGPLSDWNYTHEPAVLGGAKRIEEGVVRNGKPDKSKTIITLDAKGEETRSELALESSPKIYAKTFTREGDLLEMT